MNNKRIENKLKIAYAHIKPYIGKTETPLLISMCNRCEAYCGKNHDFDECLEQPCFKMFLGYEYMRWMDSYD